MTEREHRLPDPPVFGARPVNPLGATTVEKVVQPVGKQPNRPRLLPNSRLEASVHLGEMPGLNLPKTPLPASTGGPTVFPRNR